MSAPDSVAVRVTRRVWSDIIFGRIAPDARLTEKLLSEQYGVSRVPMRECLRAFEAESLVVVRPYAGATVVEVQPEDLDALLDVRRTLEGEMVRRTAMRAQGRSGLGDAGQSGPDEDWRTLRHEIERVLAAGDKALGDGRVDELPGLNERFNSQLADMSPSPSLSGSLTAGLGEDREALRAHGHVPGRRRVGRPQATLAAVIDGRLDEAGGLMAAHLECSRTGRQEGVAGDRVEAE